MLYRLADIDIERFIEEDVPYGDLTTLLPGSRRYQCAKCFSLCGNRD
ncbi:MAG: hypothetical protein ACOYOE_02425 [Chlorobium sp.]